MLQVPGNTDCLLMCCWFWSFRGFTGGGKVEEPKQEKDNVINIFSVASGHLYERFLRWRFNTSEILTNISFVFNWCKDLIDFDVFVSSVLFFFHFLSSLRIMMLSVLKNTKTPVKFWFLKNYLSPTFKVVRRSCISCSFPVFVSKTNTKQDLWEDDAAHKKWRIRTSSYWLKFHFLLLLDDDSSALSWGQVC